jgi:hypothetical protein
MLGKTHKRISLLFAYAGCLAASIWKPDFLSNYLPVAEEGWSLVNYLNFLMMMAVCAEFCKEGTLFPDLDHAWVNLKEKTAITKVINVLIHLTGGKHRSRQTHSLDICLICTAGYIFLVIRFLQDAFTYPLWLFAGVGFFSGWITHLFADMLTGEGIYIFFWQKKKVAFVPKKFLWIKFNTGGAWEDFVYKVATGLEWAFCTLACIYPIIILGIQKFL